MGLGGVFVACANNHPKMVMTHTIFSSQSICKLLTAIVQVGCNCSEALFLCFFVARTQYLQEISAASIYFPFPQSLLSPNQYSVHKQLRAAQGLHLQCSCVIQPFQFFPPPNLLLSILPCLDVCFFVSPTSFLSLQCIHVFGICKGCCILCMSFCHLVEFWHW